MATPNVQNPGKKESSSMPNKDSEKRKANTSVPDSREAQKASHDMGTEKGAKKTTSTNERSSDRPSSDRSSTSDRSSESRTSGKPH